MVCRDKVPKCWHCRADSSLYFSINRRCVRLGVICCSDKHFCKTNIKVGTDAQSLPSRPLFYCIKQRRVADIGRRGCGGLLCSSVKQKVWWTGRLQFQYSGCHACFQSRNVSADSYYLTNSLLTINEHLLDHVWLESVYFLLQLEVVCGICKETVYRHCK